MYIYVGEKTYLTVIVVKRGDLKICAVKCSFLYETYREKHYFRTKFRFKKTNSIDK